MLHASYLNQLLEFISEQGLNQLSLVLQQATSEDELLARIRARLPVLLAPCSGEIILVDDARRSSSPLLCWGRHGVDDETPSPPRDGIAGQVPDKPTGTAGGPWTRVDVPLQIGRTRLGLLRLSLGESYFDRSVATAAADIIAMALHNGRLREALRQQAIRDPLTGLYNRRFLEDHLHRELRRARRADAPISLLLLDLDHFKQINDSFGHPGGDQVLKAVAGFLGRSIRGEDIVCRIGGEPAVSMP